MRRTWLVVALVVPTLLLCSLLLWAQAGQPSTDMFDRLQSERLAARHADIVKYAAARKPAPLPHGLQDLRAVIHAHCFISHDSRGTLADYISACKATNTKVVMMSDHPSEKYDFFKDGFSGMHEGILFFPGAETGGLLIYPMTPIDLKAHQGREALLKAVLDTGGIAFASHIEEWPEAPWNMAGLLGTEMYNTHFEIKRRPEFANLDAPKMLTLIKAAGSYGDEAFGAIQSAMTEYLVKFDRETQVRRFVGVGANDSHCNTGVVVKGGKSEGMVVLEDPLGEPLMDQELPAALVQAMGIPLPEKLTAGQVGFAFTLDTYERSFRHVGTHLLAPKLEKQAVLEALRAGHAYVSFDWVADPAGFIFQAEGADKPAIMGDEVAFKPGLKLTAALPLAAQVRLIKNGTPVALPGGEQPSAAFSYDVPGPGVYRLEAWLKVGDEILPWIYTNPIYVR